MGQFLFGMIVGQLLRAFVSKLWPDPDAAERRAERRRKYEIQRAAGRYFTVKPTEAEKTYLRQLSKTDETPEKIWKLLADPGPLSEKAAQYQPTTPPGEEPIVYGEVVKVAKFSAWLSFDCSCYASEWANPCRHINCLITAEAENYLGPGDQDKVTEIHALIRDTDLILALARSGITRATGSEWSVHKQALVRLYARAPLRSKTLDAVA